MTGIQQVFRDLCEATEFAAIITQGAEGPHVVGNWGDYMRALGIKDNVIVFPAGRYRQTENNLKKNSQIQMLVASKRVRGSHSIGQGCLISGTGEVLTSGDIVDAVKAKFPWARGALVIHVADIQTQL